MKITSGDLRNIIRSEAKKASVINEQPGLSLGEALAKVMSALAREMYDQKGSRYEKADKSMKRLKASVGELKSIMKRMQPDEVGKALDRERLLAPGMFSVHTPKALRKTRDSSSLVDSFEAVSEILIGSDERGYPNIGKFLSRMGKSLNKYAPKGQEQFTSRTVKEPEKLLSLKIDVSKKRHRRGDAVKTVQLALANQGIKVEADGAFGPKTRAAIKKFQDMLGLKADGIAGPNTLKKLAGRVERQDIARPLRQMIEAGIIVGARGGKAAKKAKPKAEPKAEPKAPEAPEEERGVGEDEEPGDEPRRPLERRFKSLRVIDGEGKRWTVYSDFAISGNERIPTSGNDSLLALLQKQKGQVNNIRKVRSQMIDVLTKAPTNESLKLTASNLRKIIREEIAKSVASSPVALTADQLRNLIISEAAKLGATDLLQEDLQSIVDTGEVVSRRRRRRSRAKPKVQPKPGAGGGKPGDPAEPATPAEEEKEELMDELEMQNLAIDVADSFVTNLEMESGLNPFDSKTNWWTRVTDDEAEEASSAFMKAVRKVPLRQQEIFVGALEQAIQDSTGEDLYVQMRSAQGGRFFDSPAKSAILKLTNRVKAAKRGKLKISESRTRVLAEASRRDQVKSIQQALVQLGYDLGKFGPNKDGVDGDFGRKTEEAVKMFQRENSLDPTGSVGAGTAEALMKATEGKEAETKAAADAEAKRIEDEKRAAEERGRSAEENKAEMESEARRALDQAEILGAEVFGDRTGAEGAPLMFIIDRPSTELEAGANSETAGKLKDLMMKVFFGTSRMLDMKDIEVEIAELPEEMIRLTVTGPAREKGAGPLSDEEAAKLFESSQTSTRRVRLNRSRK